MAIGPKRVVTRQEARFAEVLTETGSSKFAAIEAKYAMPEAKHAQIAAKPQIQATVRALQEKRLNNDLLPLALSVIEKVLTSDAEKTRDKLTAAKLVVDRTIGMGRDAAADKAPEDMTAEELSARIALLRVKQAEIAQEANTIDAEVIEDSPRPSVFD